MRVAVAHHLGWAVVVTASQDHRVVDRRRVALVEPGVPGAPYEHDTQGLDVADAEALVSAVRASAVRATTAALGRLAADLPGPVASLSLRYWPPDFPTELTLRRRPPYSAVADSVMYREVLADAARAKGWAVHLFDAAAVLGQAARVLGPATEQVLHGPRSALGPPWTKDHRIALAAAILAGHDDRTDAGESPHARPTIRKRTIRY